MQLFRPREMARSSWAKASRSGRWSVESLTSMATRRWRRRWQRIPGLTWAKRRCSRFQVVVRPVRPAVATNWRRICGQGRGGRRQPAFDQRLQFARHLPLTLAPGLLDEAPHHLFTKAQRRALGLAPELVIIDGRRVVAGRHVFRCALLAVRPCILGGVAVPRTFEIAGVKGEVGFAVVLLRRPPFRETIASRPDGSERQAGDRRIDGEVAAEIPGAAVALFAAQGVEVEKMLEEMFEERFLFGGAEGGELGRGDNQRRDAVIDGDAAAGRGDAAAQAEEEMSVKGAGLEEPYHGILHGQHRR